MKTSNKRKKKLTMLQGRSYAAYLIGLIVLFMVVLSMISCKPIEKTVYVPIIQRYDSIVLRYVKDTTIDIPIQYNRNVTSQKSHLETDLAISDALIDTSGLLVHSIQNKGKVPSKFTIEKINVKDTVQVPVLIEKEIPGEPYPVYVPQKGFYYYLGKWAFIMLIVLIAFAIILGLKRLVKNSI